jgi:hypothetical protein
MKRRARSGSGQVASGALDEPATIALLVKARAAGVAISLLILAL